MVSDLPLDLSPQRVVLLVDDDDSVRKLLRRQLDGTGYLVLEATSGAEALEILQLTRSVELLITDVIMPDMSGPELARLWTDRLPQTQVLFVSGFSESELIGNELLASGRADFLGKPFSAQIFLAKIVALLKPAALAHSVSSLESSLYPA